MSERLRKTLRFLTADYFGFTGLGVVVAGSALATREWLIAGCAGFVVVTNAWRSAAAKARQPSPRTDLLGRLIALDTEAERLIRRLATPTDGSAHADSINWCRKTAEWLRAEKLVGHAAILDPVWDYAQREYGRPLTRREEESANDIRLAVENVRGVLRMERDHLHAHILDEARRKRTATEGGSS